jgi:hypothetical protein
LRGGPSNCSASASRQASTDAPAKADDDEEDDEDENDEDEEDDEDEEEDEADDDEEDEEDDEDEDDEDDVEEAHDEGGAGGANETGERMYGRTSNSKSGRKECSVAKTQYSPSRFTVSSIQSG